MNPASTRHLQAHIAQLLANRIAPPRPDSQIEYRYTEGMKAPLVCYLDYDPGEPKTLEHPGSPASCTLAAAYVRDVDIADLLSDKVRSDIEETGLINHESSSL